MEVYHDHWFPEAAYSAPASGDLLSQILSIIAAVLVLIVIALLIDKWIMSAEALDRRYYRVDPRRRAGDRI